METDKKKDLGILVVRLVLGAILLVGGLNMVMSFFNGPTLSSFTKSLEGSGIIYPEIVALICLASFIIVGISLILGIFVRFSAVLGILVVIFFIVFLQWKNGLSVYVGGMEYSLLILSNFILLFLTGAGEYSLYRGK